MYIYLFVLVPEAILVSYTANFMNFKQLAMGRTGIATIHNV